MTGVTPPLNVVEYTVWHIAPEKVGKPVEIQMPSSFLKDGLITEALKSDLFRERKVLLPKGSKQPVARQHWNSDPRPYVTLYRGEEGSNEQDLLIGEFEVLGVPNQTNVNVSTVCVVADGKMFVTARDNSNNKILEVRRR